jgi:hypothetical protein
MLKLLMKKLGTPASEPPSVEGRGGVSADGDMAFVLALAPEPVGGDCACSVWALPRTRVAVRGCRRRARTSGAGTVVVSVVAVVVVVGPVVVPVGAVVWDGWDGGGAGTVVVSVVGDVDACGALTAAVVSASATPGTRMESAAKGGISAVVSVRRIIGQLPSR